jgi:GntR family transcriptional regulator
MDRPSSLYLSVKNEIEELIAKGEIKPGDKLPSEYDLAKRFAVSRMTLREALRALEEEGWLARKQGIGTFVRVTSPRIKSILDINYGVTEMIKNMGFEPGTKEMRIEEVRADSQIVKALNVEKGLKIITIERVRTANKAPVVYSLDMLPASILPDPKALDRIGESIYDFLESRCNIVLSSSIARLFPTKANRKIAEKLNIKVNTPLFLIEQQDTDHMGRLVAYSREYFVSDYFDFLIYRRRKK